MGSKVVTTSRGLPRPIGSCIAKHELGDVQRPSCRHPTRPLLPDRCGDLGDPTAEVHGVRALDLVPERGLADQPDPSRAESRQAGERRVLLETDGERGPGSEGHGGSVIPAIHGGEDPAVPEDPQPVVVGRVDAACEPGHHAARELHDPDGEVGRAHVERDPLVLHGDRRAGADPPGWTEEGGEPAQVVPGVLERAPHLELVLGGPGRSGDAHPGASIHEGNGTIIDLGVDDPGRADPVVPERLPDGLGAFAEDVSGRRRDAQPASAPTPRRAGRRPSSSSRAASRSRRASRAPGPARDTSRWLPGFVRFTTSSTRGSPRSSSSEAYRRQAMEAARTGPPGRRPGRTRPRARARGGWASVAR